MQSRWQPSPPWREGTRSHSDAEEALQDEGAVATPSNKASSIYFSFKSPSLIAMQLKNLFPKLSC